MKCPNISPLCLAIRFDICISICTLPFSYFYLGHEVVSVKYPCGKMIKSLVFVLDKYHVCDSNMKWYPSISPWRCHLFCKNAAAIQILSLAWITNVLLFVRPRRLPTKRLIKIKHLDWTATWCVYWTLIRLTHTFFSFGPIHRFAHISWTICPACKSSGTWT